MFEDNVEQMKLMEQSKSPSSTSNTILSFLKSTKGIIIIGSTIVVLTVIIIVVSVSSSSSSNEKEPDVKPTPTPIPTMCEMGEGEKCLVCDENNIKICGKCNEFYDMK